MTPFILTIPGGGSTSDAENQPDLLFAFNSHRYNDSEPVVNIHFYHALAAVKFDITNVEDMTVEAIELRNVCSSGSCSMTAPINMNSFNWTPSSSKTSYKQIFDSTTDFEAVNGRKTYTRKYSMRSSLTIFIRARNILKKLSRTW